MGLAGEAAGGAGGVPGSILVDRGLDFASAAVKQSMGAFAVQVAKAPPHAPHLKGRIERAFDTIDTSLLATLPGYRNGPRTVTGRLYGPVDDRIDRSKEPAPILAIPLTEFVTRFAAWVAWYNLVHQHASLGTTPYQAWMADPTPVYRVAPEQLRHLLLIEEDRTITTKGVQYDSLYYVGPGMQGRGGQHVQIRYMPHDNRYVEVFQDGQYLGRAEPRTKLSPEMKEEYRAVTRAQGRRLGKMRQAATRRARVRLAPMTDAENRMIDTVEIDPAALRESAGYDRQRALDKRASASLLGLKPPGVRAAHRRGGDG